MNKSIDPTAISTHTHLSTDLGIEGYKQTEEVLKHTIFAAEEDK